MAPQLHDLVAQHDVALGGEHPGVVVGVHAGAGRGDAVARRGRVKPARRRADVERPAPQREDRARLEEAAEPEIAVGGGALAERPGVADESARVGQGPGGERARRRRGQGAHAVHTVHASQRQDAASTRA